MRFGNEGERDRSLNEMMGHYIASRPIRVSLATAKKNPGGLQARLYVCALAHTTLALARVFNPLGCAARVLVQCLRQAGRATAAACLC